MSCQAQISVRSLLAVRIALGFVYFYFGFLKFFPDLSPAEILASQTILRLSLSWLDAHTALRLLAAMECLIGVALIFGVGLRVALCLFLIHMTGTLLPLVCLPEFTFKVPPFAPTLEGQYILKNIVFLTAGWAVLFPCARRPQRPEPAGAGKNKGSI